VPRTSFSVTDPAYRLGAVTLLGAVVVVSIALGFQYLGGYNPCPLCLQQRWAYYVAVPATFLALILLATDHRGTAGLLLFLVSVAFLLNAGLGVYHAGAEWKFWPGPDTCSGTGPATAQGGSLLQRLEAVRVIRCDEAPWRFLGLSFAGWNVATSLLLWITAQGAAFAAAQASRNASH
jgi:disulfide bond formation protein DsbB